jgi:16S rRNA (cytosine1402-N4)-methyltransferase
MTGEEWRVETYHKPVLLGPVLEHLVAVSPRVLLDATLGGGGHAEGLLEALPESRLIGMDADPAALEFARARLAKFGGRFDAVQGNFRQMDRAIAGLGLGKLDAIVMDLGVSSRQLEDPRRGFSFRFEGPLDMRMDPAAGVPAAEWINQATEEELTRVIREYGEERHARRIARAIVHERKTDEIRTTQQFSELVARAVGAPAAARGRTGSHGGKIHPATRTFQAVRIVVNDELGALEEGLAKAVELLSVGGRLAVITFHSLEDRLVKSLFRKEQKVTGRLRWINKHVIRPEIGEIRQNPRSRSAKLRVVEKLKDF